MIRVALKIAYIGEFFFGSQRQKNFITIDGEIIRCLKTLNIIEDEKKNKYYSCCRTDTGVNAITYVVTFDTNIEVSYPKMINSIIKENIFVYSYSIVPLNFHPRYSATNRSYLYIMNNLNYDIEIMKAGAKLLLGKHDFYNFCKNNKNIVTTRTINKINISLVSNKIYVTIEASSFLWKMVRKIIYSLSLIGQKERNIDWILKLLNPSKYNENLKCMPSNGLILKNIEYKNYLLFWRYDRYTINNIKKRLIKDIFNYEIKNNVLKEIFWNINKDKIKI